MSTRKESSGRDQGSALIMAIVFVTVIGVAMAAGLGYAAATLRAESTAYAPARDKLYASDAAIKAAINYVRNNPSEGNSSTNPACAPVRDYGVVRGEQVTTQVCPQGGASLTPLGGGSSWGLSTLATGSEAGLDISGTVQVNGNVLANSAITGGSLVVAAGTVKALGGCSGTTVTVDGAPFTTCQVATPPAVDPGYVTGLTEAPAAATGSCNASTEIASLQPGTWSSQAAIDAAAGSCTIINFLPGIHYFPSVPWPIKSRVVAGRLVPGFSSATPFGAACVRGGAAADGAMLVFGGSSVISLQGSSPSLEVCGRSVNQPALGKSVRIPVFGPTVDVFTTYSNTFSLGTNPTGTSWVNPAYARTVNATQVATYSLARNRTSNPLLFSSVTPQTALPTWTVPRLTADVTAKSTVANDKFTVTALNSDGSTACTTGTAGTLTTTLARVTVSLTCTKPLVSPLTLRFAATSPNFGSTRTISVDGLALGYTNVPGPTISAQSGCVAAPGGCAFLSSTGNGNTFWFDGEVYLPKAKIDVQLPNNSLGFTTLGMVIRVLKVKTTGSTQTVPVVAVDNGNLSNGDVTIVAKVGSDSWMTCRVSLSVAGPSVTGATIQGCTVPR